MSNSPRASVLRFILDNTAWLIGSLLLALIVWFAAVNQQNPVEQQRFSSTIPVQVLKDDNLLIVQDPLPVQVVVRAPHSVWDVLDANDITVIADLKGKPAGKYTIALVASLSPQRLGAVSAVLPSQITVELAKRSEQAFTISVTPSADPPVGYKVASTKTSETSAKVSGSEELVKQVAAVVARVDLSEQSKPVTRVVDLLPVNAEGSLVSGVTVVPQQVTAVIDIQPRPGVRELKVVPSLLTTTIPVGYFLSGYSSNPPTVAVLGDASIIDTMNGSVTTEQIDLTNKTASFTQTVKLALPSGVTLTNPVNIIVSVTIEPITVTKQFDNIVVETQGLDPADFTISTQPDHVSVIVRGPQSILDTLQASDITVIAPLAGLGGGTYTVTLQASIAHSGLTNDNSSIPNPQAQVTIVARHPTPTPTASPIPTATQPATETATP